VRPEFVATQAPWFTLFGDGTIVARDPLAAVDPPADGHIRGVPFRTARLSPDRMDAVLANALVQGGLGVARASYMQPNVADAGTTTFEIHAGGVDKKVEVVALGMEGQAGPDELARRSFAGLVERLSALSRDGSISVSYEPHAFRAILFGPNDGVGPQPPIAWPWKDLAPTDFRADPSGVGLNARLSAAQVAALGLDAVSGGLQDVPILSPTGSGWYSLSLRPLLPDEAS
jgi:hypothetical protein